jgi:hypothetical protein
MKMNKILALVVATVMLVTMMMVPAQASAAVLFEDDFSSSDLAAKWQNPVLDGRPETGDTECENVTNVKDGVLELNNEDQFGTFFYLGMSDLKLLNFTVTMRIRARQFNNSWLGVSFRKDFNDRFNGCNNNMATVSFRTDGSGKTVVTTEAYRGYAGSGPVQLSGSVNGNVAVAVDEWMEWRLEVKDTSFKSYVNGQLIGQWEYKKNQNEGFLSLNCCIFDGAVDSIKVTEYEALPSGDTDPTEPPATEPPATEPGATDAPTEPPATEPPATNPPKQPLIERKYKDVTIDNTFNVITLDRLLNVEEMLDSFTLGDDVTIRLVDEAGAEVTDQAAMVTDTMKLEVLRNGELAKTYTLVINAEMPSDPTEPPVETPEPDEGLPIGVIIAIVAGVAVVAAVAVVLIVKNKKGKEA